MTLDHLARFHLCYLASPYTRFKAGHDAAFRQINALACKLIARGLRIFIPVTMGHPLSVAAMGGFLDPNDGELWDRINAPFVKVCDALVIVTMEGFDISRGVNKELNSFLEQGKPIVWLDPHDLSVTPVPALRAAREMGAG